MGNRQSVQKIIFCFENLISWAKVAGAGDKYEILFFLKVKRKKKSLLVPRFAQLPYRVVGTGRA